MKLQQNYYTERDTLWIARDLLGKHIYTQLKEGEICSAVITETEAYLGTTDKGSHAWNNRRTTRTETMYKKGGISYIYLCYGIHHLFNVVTSHENIPHAILIRGVFPVQGIACMEKRLNKKPAQHLNGPGKFTKAMGITTLYNNISLLGDTIWIEDQNMKFEQDEIMITPRIGIDYAGKDALLPYRFVIKNEKIMIDKLKQY
ncbi:MAG: DNA-3-methyladenine glycosylase [Bacteroidota bacterium]